MTTIRRTNFLLLLIISISLFPQSRDSVIDNRILKLDKSLLGKDYHIQSDSLFSLLKLSKNLNYQNGTSDLYRRLGSLFKKMGNYDSAINYYLRAIEYSTKANDYFSSASSHNQIGIIYYRINELSSSSFYFKKAFTEYKKANKKRGMADAGGNISEIETKLGNYKEGLKYALLGLKSRREYKDTSQVGRNYYALGYVYEGKASFDSSKKYYLRALERGIIAKDISNIIQTLNGLGRAHILVNQYDSSLAYHHKALDTSIKYQYQPLIAETYSYLTKTYEKKGDFPIALHYLKQLKSLDSTLLDSSTIKYITDAETRYRTRETELKITEQIQATKLSNLWLVITIILSIAILIISALLLFSYRNKRQAAIKEAELQRSKVDDLLQKQEVENVNAMLKGQDEERKRIAQELHDRIGSILSTVKLHFSNVEEGINALKEQQNKSYNEAVGLLDEAVDEVRRISHDLYEGSLAKFGFATALRQLITAIEKANIIKIDFINTVEYEVDIKPYEQGLYRITQELLSNTLKYADAKQITLQLNKSDDGILYMYEDDGKGFDKKLIEDKGGIGYKNIEARVAKMDGTWFLDTRPLHGMTLSIEIPIPPVKEQL